LVPSNRVYGSGLIEGSVNVLTVSDCSWTVANTSSWLVVTSPTNGSGNGTVTFTAPPSLLAQDRSAVLDISGQSFVVTQLGTSCKYTYPTTNRLHTYTASTGTVSVSTGTNCSWRVFSTNTAWISVISASNMLGNGTASYLVAANPSTQARTGSFMIVEQPL